MLVVCWADFAGVFLQSGFVFLGHKINLSLLDKTSMSKNIQILQ